MTNDNKHNAVPGCAGRAALSKQAGTYQWSQLPQVMGYHQDGALRLEALQGLCQLCPGTPIQARQGLIKEQHLQSASTLLIIEAGAINRARSANKTNH